jgi:hypothetical protein
VYFCKYNCIYKNNVPFIWTTLVFCTLLLGAYPSQIIYQWNTLNLREDDIFSLSNKFLSQLVKTKKKLNYFFKKIYSLN